MNNGSQKSAKTRKKRWFAGCLIILFILGSGMALLFYSLPHLMAPTLPRSFVLYLSLSGDIPEYQPQSPYAALASMGRKPLTVFDIIRALSLAQTDDRVTGLVISLRGTSLGLARVQELTNALTEFKRVSKKPVTAFIDLGDDSDYFLALPADEIVMAPSGFLLFDGIHFDVILLRKFFDRLGIEFQMVQHGPYKSAAEPFTRDKLSDEARQMYGWILRSLEKNQKNLLKLYRSSVYNQWETLLSRGMLAAQTAMESKVVDRLESWPALKNRIKKDKSVRWVSVHRYLRAHPLDRSSGDLTCALVFAVGSINSGRGTPGETIGSDTYVHLFRHIAQSSIPCVLIRDDSPGGSGTASDEIYEAIEYMKEKGKKVVVSMGDVAGSGGYYIAMNADKIVAQPSTITGSIGVLAGKPNFKHTMEKLGINVETLKSNENAGFWSPFEPLSENELKSLKEETEKFYWSFVNKVARHRKKTPEAVHQIAQGRIWTGEQALQHGLVDALGGFNEATKILVELVGKDPEKTKVRWKIYPREKKWYEILSEALEVRTTTGKLLHTLPDASLRRVIRPYLILLNEPVVYLMPPLTIGLNRPLTP